MPVLIRPLVGLAVGLIATLSAGTPAFAHIDPDPKDAPAGSEQSVGFTVEHGCEGSPTVQLDMRLPDGVTEPIPEAPAGWTASVVDNVVTFVGGPLPDDVEETFRVRMTLPSSPGSTIYFPFVQRCEQGEIRWIDLPSDGSGTDLDEPAPAMNLTAAIPTTTSAPAATTTTPPSTTEVPTTSAPPTTDPATTVASTAPPTTEPASSPATNVPADTGPVITTNDESGEADGAVGSLVFVGTMAAVAVVAGLMYWQIRRQRSS